jgi:hypothetical protein
MAPDKQKHMIAGFSCFGMGYIVGMLTPFPVLCGLAAAFAAGIGREVLNATGKFGVAKTGFDVADIAYTVALPCVVAGAVYLL